MLSVVIPFYNEAKRLPQTLQTVHSFFDKNKKEFEIILVNDGSTDDTLGEVQEFLSYQNVHLYNHDENKGKGAAIKTGVMYSRGDYILFTDADLSTPINEYDILFEYILNGADIVIGSRALKNSRVKASQPGHREKIGRLGNILIRFLLKLPFKDTQCGFKLFKKHIAKDLFSTLEHERWSFDYEILYKAFNKGYKIKEVGVEWHDSRPSKFHPLRDSIKCFFDLINIKKKR